VADGALTAAKTAGTAVVTADSRLSDARTPTAHDNTKHSVAYAANSDLTTHTGAAAPHSGHAATAHTHAASAIDSGTLDGDRLPAATATKRGGVPATGAPAGKFLKDNDTWAAAGGQATIKQTEIDFGSSPKEQESFTITDADVTTGSHIIGYVALETPTGRDLDEVRAERLTVLCGNGAGSFPMEVQAIVGRVSGMFKINYLIG